MIDIIGKVISPLKLAAFVILIAVGLLTFHPISHTSEPLASLAKDGISLGYATMDLLGAFFYCTVAYRSISEKCKKSNITNKGEVIGITLKSCLLGSFLISFIYIGFMLVALFHSQELLGTPTPALINKVSHVVLGSVGSLFVCFFVFFACLATATALAEVSSDYFHKTLFRKGLSRNKCLILVLSIMYSMSILGFDAIMKFSLPILNLLYPALIILCFINIFSKLKLFQYLSPKGFDAPLL